MNANTETDLPCWARKALGYAGAPLAIDADEEGPRWWRRRPDLLLGALLAGYPDSEGPPYSRAHGCPEGFAERVAARWLEIEHDVLPSLADLSDTGKGYFFRVMFGEGVRFAGDTPREARADVRWLDDTRRAIADKAVELAELLGQQAAIHGDGLAECEMPDLWELLEEAAADYQPWATVARPTMESFLAVAGTQGRPGPCLDDLLWALARRLRGWPGVSPQPAQTVERAFRTRQASQADYVRLLLGAIDRFPLRRRADGQPRDDVVGGDAACLPVDFVLPDSALAALVSVVFDLPEGEPGIEAVRACRLARQHR